ncbi:MAG TPA: phosphoribosyl-AMP cyclohydrolase [Desulfobulbaceae bacterium]|nr:phosphoribosyl-AMP cyclohydrolase [Desulfobulbaceae bacterium]
MINLNFDKAKDGLLPAIAVDARDGQVLMLAYINRQAWEKTLATQKAHYWSRSRQQLWLKGETSGNVQLIKDIYVDCDTDAVIYKVKQLGGAACHTGHRSCFYRRVAGDKLETEGEPLFDPKKVYK